VVSRASKQSRLMHLLMRGKPVAAAIGSSLCFRVG
jgi:hypothetical protein